MVDNSQRRKRDIEEGQRRTICKTKKQTDKLREETNRQTGIYNERKIQISPHINRQTERRRDRERERERERQTDRQTDRSKKDRQRKQKTEREKRRRTDRQK